MVVNQAFLDSLKELNNLSSVNVIDPENEEFDSGRISNFDEAIGDTDDGKVFGNLRKSVNNDNLDRKYAGQKASRKSLNWSDIEESLDEDEGGDDYDLEMDIDGADLVNICHSTDDHDEEEDEDDVDNDNDEDEDGNGNELDTDADDLDEMDKGDDDENFVDDSNKIDGIYGNISNGKNDDFDNAAADDDDGGGDGDGGDDDEDEDEDVIDSSMKIDLNMIPDDLKNGLPDELNGDIENFSALVMNDNVLKGKATKSQLDLLDKLLESRIRLQKSLHLCNQLPQHDTLSLFKEQARPQIKESYESAQKLVRELLCKLLKLHEVLCETNTETSTVLTTGDLSKISPGDEEIPSDSEDEGDDLSKTTPNEYEQHLDLPSKRKHTLTVGDYGEEIVKRHKAMQSYQDTTIKKWHEKTQLASNVIKSKNFASFDKSVHQQIKRILLDKDKLIKRTQLMRVPFKILGRRSDEETKSGMVKNHDYVDLHLKDYNENIFDDGDFYHEMLKELIERKSDINADDPIAAGRRWLELQKLRSKIKRKVDTRASKGRKVRYDVHPKLVSFMAPQNVGSMSNLARNNLFASLFGKRPKVSSY